MTSSKKRVKKKAKKRSSVSKESKTPKRRVKKKAVPKKPKSTGVQQSVITVEPDVLFSFTADQSTHRNISSTFTPPNTEEIGSRRSIRWAAGIYYANTGISVEEMRKHEMFSSVPLSTLQSWSVADKWTERRKVTFEGWTRAIEQRMGNKIAQQMASELAELRNIRKKVVGIVKGKSTKPRSLEGMVGAAVKVQELINDMTRDVSAMILPEAPVGKDDSPQLLVHHVQPKLSLDEARLAAKAILEERRRKRLLEKEAKKDDLVDDLLDPEEV